MRLAVVADRAGRLNWADPPKSSHQRPHEGIEICSGPECGPVAAATLEVYMPPVVSMQGSRSGLITAVIVSVTIAVIMTVVAVYYSVEAGKSDTALASLKMINKGMYYDGAPSDQKIIHLQGLKDQFPGTSGSALELSMAESDLLAKLVGGNLDASQAAAQAKNVLATAGKRIDELNSQKLIAFELPKGSLSEVVTALTAQLAQVATDKKSTDDQLVAARKSVQDQLAAQKTQLDDKDKQIGDANAKTTAAEQKNAEYQAQIKGSLDTVTSTDSKTLKELQDANATLTTALNVANTKAKALDTMVNGLKNKLHQVRVNPSEAVVQQPDGIIIRNSDNNRCFINIGSRQSVTLGLTFEVYDKNRGVPQMGDGLADTNMPVGKASMEVVSVGPDTSECQITKIQPGQQIVVGDFISNLVFDPNTKYNFFVYGAFDLNGSGVATDNDAQIIKRLITQWGGKLQDKIDVDTDFVVMGAEPVAPTGSDPNDPQSQLRLAAYKRQAAQYQSEILSASQLSVPIMNQNRFLYFIGYFDQARR
jgi:hypothetical protein